MDVLNLWQTYINIFSLLAILLISTYLLGIHNKILSIITLIFVSILSAGGIESSHIGLVVFVLVASVLSFLSKEHVFLVLIIFISAVLSHESIEAHLPAQFLRLFFSLGLSVAGAYMLRGDKFFARLYTASIVLHSLILMFSMFNISVLQKGAAFLALGAVLIAISYLRRKK